MPLTVDYLKASDGVGDAPLMHVTNTRSIGGTTIEVDTVSNVPTKFIGTYGELLPSGFIDPATAVNFYGHLSGSDLEIDGFCAGSVDDGNTTADVVVIRPNTFWSNLIAEFIGNVSALDGSALADDVVDTDQIVDGAVEEDKIGAGSITNAKLSTDAGEPGAAWTDWSSSAAETGWSGTPTLVFRYLQIGKIVFFSVSINGTSNSVDSRVSIPVTAAHAFNGAMTYVVDNGAIQTTHSYWYIEPGALNQITFMKNSSTSTYTASGNKNCQASGFYVAA